VFEAEKAVRQKKCMFILGPDLGPSLVIVLGFILGPGFGALDFVYNFRETQTIIFFPSNAFMAYARSLHTFNRSKKMNCNYHARLSATKALVDLYAVQRRCTTSPVFKVNHTSV